MKKSNYFIYMASLCLILWGVLFLNRVFLWQNSGVISRFASQADILINFLTLISTFKIYKKMNTENRNILIWLVGVNVMLGISDVSWYSTIYLNNLYPVHPKSIQFLVNIVTVYIWDIFSIVFLFTLLNKYILQIKFQIKMLFLFGLIDTIIIFIFLLCMHSMGEYFTPLNMIQVSTLVIYVIVFNFAILCMIHAENTGLILFLSGMVILISGDFFCFYSTISQTSVLLSYGELLVLLGILFNWFGTLIIYHNGDYEIKNWVRKNTAIKSKLAFWGFMAGITSFLLFFIIAYVFSLINQEVFLGLPLFIMIYSVIVVIFSLYMGKRFEAPFKQIANNIFLMLEDKENHINGNFSTEEFTFLQKSIMDSFKFRDERDKIKHEFGMIATDMAHDIKSPLMVLNSAINNIKKTNTKNYSEDFSLIESSLRDIRNISNTMLNNYHALSGGSHSDEKPQLQEIDDGNSPRYVIISSLLENICVSKKLEWQDLPCSFNYSIQQDIKYTWAYITPTKFTRVISNLLNNAYQSLEAERNINVNLAIQDDNFLLVIQDSGCGIAENKIVDTIKGVSSKHQGKGRGLSGALGYFDSLGGKLTLESKLGYGTKLQIVFPLTNAPLWSTNTINYSNNTVFIVIDDSSTMIMLWQHIFMDLGVKCNYFTRINDFIDWYQKNKNSNTEIFLITDYDLKDENGTGLDIIFKYPTLTAYLVTNHAEESWIQEIADKHAFKLIPKSIIEHLQFIYN